MRCCAVCFGDRTLKRNIIPSKTREEGTCSYCGTENVLLIEPLQLRDTLSPLINIYEPDEHGKLLVEWLKEDWAMFDHPRMDIAGAKSLLADVLDDGEIVRARFSPSSRFQSDGLDRWELLRDELMYTNRYFPDAKIDTERLGDLLDQLKADEVQPIWYRARLQESDAPYPADKMGAPPKRIASHGRANPAGIPYLYLGSTETTAVSEIRPHTGELACIADFTLAEGLNLIDLRNPRKLISPFVLGDEDAIGAMRNDVPFLERLGEELTRPVLPRGAAIDYVPSQFLCEFIKKCDYDGVIYRSSVGEGINLALFNPSKATIGTIKQHRVAQVQVSITDIA